MDNNTFRSTGQLYQYLSLGQRTGLIRDYIRARDNYREAVARARQRYAEMVRLGLLRAEDEKSPP